ncbi:MAG TPA: hypothetical protein V6D05_00965 [Stenomitos sp.]
MSGPIAQRSALSLTPARADQRQPMPQASAGDTLSLGKDALTLSKSGGQDALSERGEAEQILNQAILPAISEKDGRDIFVPAPIPPVPSKSPVAIQKLRFADNFNDGKETELDFEQYPGDLTPRPQPPVFIQTDPRTGGTDLALKEVRARLSGGDYDVYVKVSGDGSVGIDRIMKGGRNITSIAKDALVEKIKEDPALYGTLSALAVAGAVAAAHEYTRRSGDPIEFDALNQTLLERDNFKVETSLKAELTGTKSFVRPASAELAAHYGDERLDAYASAKYRIQDDEWEANVGANYKVGKDTNLTAGAFYRTRNSDYGAFVGLTSTF